LRLEIEPNLPQVDCGFDRLKQILLNLCENALKFSPTPSEIKLSARYQAPWVEISVTDQGPGIPEADQPLIWGRFVRGTNGRNVTGSTGLGLAIVNTLTQAYHGQVALSSMPGHGATFYVRLPAVDITE
ncbi:MAG: ATP-binding protein, partial [Peptococcaceae bacterium]|nr:ATP-binding protein [Peptococcaceae bacterium]